MFLCLEDQIEFDDQYQVLKGSTKCSDITYQLQEKGGSSFYQTTESTQKPKEKYADTYAFVITVISRETKPKGYGPLMIITTRKRSPIHLKQPLFSFFFYLFQSDDKASHSITQCMPIFCSYQINVALPKSNSTVPSLILIFLYFLEMLKGAKLKVLAKHRHQLCS